MIEIIEDEILISTEDTSFLLSHRNGNRLTVEYYGPRINFREEIPSLMRRYILSQGSSLVREDTDPFSGNDLKLAVSSMGNGDFFLPSIMIREHGTLDFFFSEARIQEVSPLDHLPFPHGGEKELVVTLKDSVLPLELELHYTVFEKENVICCHSVLMNRSKEVTFHIQKLASMQLSLTDQGFSLYSTYGCWANELNVTEERLTPGRKTIDSLCGYSSNRHNPAFALLASDVSLTSGSCYGFNLMYSGNFENSVEMDAFSLVRIQSGISSSGLDYPLRPMDYFVTPVAITSYSSKGTNGLGKNMQDFVLEHVVPKGFRNRQRPIVYNNWEATGMKFTKGKIVSLMKKAKSLGMELFVLDDGWFSTRDDDSHGLGDWRCNLKKIPGGLRSLSDEAKKLGLGFGIWMEPEMVNDDTEVYRKHPDWIIHDVHTAYRGRHQYVLDLSKAEVQQFLIDSVSQVLESADISYLKWDLNRNISNYPSMSLSYDYMFGLYHVLQVLVSRFPKVLFENCASGGNRFDLGMLSYFPQSWMSDDTDSYQRESIQMGASLFYPPSVMSNHVAAKTSNQLMRKTSLDTKFEVTMHGVLGYELDLDDLFEIDKKTIKDQIAFYLKYRDTLQFGNLFTVKARDGEDDLMIETIKDDLCIVSVYRSIETLSKREGRLKALYLNPDALYSYRNRVQRIPLQKFGSLVNYVSPVHLKEDGVLFSMVAKHMEMKSESDEGVVDGTILSLGLGPVLSQEWSGVGYNDKIRLMGDFSSRSYVIERIQKE